MDFSGIGCEDWVDLVQDRGPWMDFCKGISYPVI
jgi:hypothetical protein